MDQRDILSQLDKNIKRGSALETLMQVDAVLDSLNVYVYKNWIEGEVVDGPHIERYWVTVTLMYPHKLMPDPEGAMRLIDNNCRVYYGKDTLVTAAKLIEPEDSDGRQGPDDDYPGAPKAKKIKRKVWMVTLEIPREYMDSITTGKIRIDDLSIDSEKVEQAYEDGMGEEDAIRTAD